jgi:hypothetical protein
MDQETQAYERQLDQSKRQIEAQQRQIESLQGQGQTQQKPQQEDPGKKLQKCADLTRRAIDRRRVSKTQGRLIIPDVAYNLIM